MQAVYPNQQGAARVRPDAIPERLLAHEHENSSYYVPHGLATRGKSLSHSTSTGRSMCVYVDALNEGQGMRGGDGGCGKHVCRLIIKRDGDMPQGVLAVG